MNHSRSLTSNYESECIPRKQIPNKIENSHQLESNQQTSNKYIKQSMTEMKDIDSDSLHKQRLSDKDTNIIAEDSNEIDNQFLNHGYSQKQLSQRARTDKQLSSSDSIVATSISTNHQRLSNESALRLQKARFKTLEANFQQMIEIKNDKDKQINHLNKQLKQIESQNQKQQKKIINLEKKYRNQSETNSELLCKIERIERENSRLNRELTEAKCNKSNKKEMIRNSNIKLNRALEEAEKYRRLLAKYKCENSNHNQIKQNQFNLIQQENQKLKKQKVELLSAFRKQMKLIDILKKQKVLLQQVFIALIKHAQDVDCKLYTYDRFIWKPQKFYSLPKINL